MTVLLLALAQMFWGFAFVGALVLMGLALRAAVRDTRRYSDQSLAGRRPFVPEQRS